MLYAQCRKFRLSNRVYLLESHSEWCQYRAAGGAGCQGGSKGIASVLHTARVVSFGFFAHDPSDRPVPALCGASGRSGGSMYLPDLSVREPVFRGEGIFFPEENLFPESLLGCHRYQKYRNTVQLSVLSDRVMYQSYIHYACPGVGYYTFPENIQNQILCPDRDHGRIRRQHMADDTLFVAGVDPGGGL